MAITGAGAPAAIDAVAVTADVLIGHIRYCWGAVWTCPGLERRIRSLLDLTMLTALNCSHELTIHVPGALRNGCTEDEIRETLLQAMIYCGVPAGMEAFRVAVEVLDGEEQGAAARSGDGPAHTPTVRPGAEPRGDGCS
jgi:alkylhydroperoxidase/carboxymuconolactone decarboxylase family protein YurZ